MTQSHKVFCLNWRKFQISPFHYSGCNFKEVGVLGKTFKQCWKRSLCPHSQFGLLPVSIQWSLIACTVCVWGCSSILFGISQLFRYKRKPQNSCQDSLFQRPPLDRQEVYSLHQLHFKQSQDASHLQAPCAMYCTHSQDHCYKNTTLAAGNTILSLQRTPGTENLQKPITSHGKGVLHRTQGRMTQMLSSADMSSPGQMAGGMVFLCRAVHRNGI